MPRALGTPSLSNSRTSRGSKSVPEEVLRVSLFVDLLQSIQDSELSTSFRESTYVWGFVDGVHVIGLCVFLGMLLFWELRLFNVGVRTATPSETWARLSPWIFAGFVIMVLSGITLFCGEPVRYWASVFFRVKLVALVLAGLNAVAFHYGIGRKLVQWDTTPLPQSAHIIGILSITLWVLIMFCGRLIAYNWLPPIR
jgi:hypothetical protein